MALVTNSVNMTEDVFRINILNLDCDNKELEFVLLYPIEGNWYAKGIVSYRENQWATEISSGGTAD
ncbi:hypothetical protein ACOCEA_03985 [Maribacter sp. CXY002]|uniref:hypothetical protein n=1 Tax=Maribacter luteocoastalis TaxID=3407671 RepID=UPI003B672BDA